MRDTCQSCVQQANWGDKTQSLESGCEAGGRAGEYIRSPEHKALRRRVRAAGWNEPRAKGYRAAQGPAEAGGPGRVDGMAGCVSQLHPTLGCRNAVGRTEFD